MSAPLIVAAMAAAAAMPVHAVFRAHRDLPPLLPAHHPGIRGPRRGGDPPFEVECDHAAERRALLALHAATNGDDWKWPWDTSPDDYCEWGFVRDSIDPFLDDPFGTAPEVDDMLCSDNGCLMWLSLQNRRLAGTIPPEIWDIPNLEFLELSNNRALEGTIPPLRLDSMIGLVMRDCSLTGTIPPLPVGVVDLSFNELHGTIPPLFPQTWFFEASHNGLTGPIPPLPPQMQLLDLAFNRLTSLPDTASLSELRAIVEFNVQGNRLGGFVDIPVVFHLKPTLFLVLEDNPELTGVIGGRFPVIRFLSVGNTNFTGTVAAMSAPFMTYLEVSDSLVGGPVDLTGMPLLKEFYGTNCAFTGSLPRSLQTLRNLEAIHLAHNALTGTLPDLSVIAISVTSNFLHGPMPGSRARPIRADLLLAADNMFTTLPGLPNGGLGVPLSGVVDCSNNMIEEELPRLGAFVFYGRNNLLFGELVVQRVFAGFFPYYPEVGPISLDLGDNLLSGTISPTLDGGRTLTSLLLDGNLLTSVPWQWAQSSHAPRSLVGLADVRFQEAEAVFPELRSLSLDNNPLEMEAYAFLIPLKALQLDELSCANCGLYGTVGDLSEPFFISLDQDEWQIDPEDQEYLHDPPTLGSTDIIPVPGFGQLQTLDLSQNNFTNGLTGIVPASLSVLSLAGSPLTGVLDASWLSSLLSLDVSGAVSLSLEPGAAFEDFFATTTAFTALGTFECPELLPRFGNVIAGPSVVRYEPCRCAAGYMGTPPDCVPCPADSFSVGDGAPECTPCPDGSSTLGEAQGTALSVCVCEAGLRQDDAPAELSGHCMPCEAGTFAPVAASPSCTTCATGFHSEQGAPECFACPDEVSCQGGVLVPLPGHYRVPSTGAVTAETRFYACDPPEICAIADNGLDVECANDHEGLLCAACAPGHARFDGRCYPCSSREVSWFLLVLSMLVFGSLCAAVVIRSQRGRGSLLSVVFKVVSTHVQTTLIVRRFDGGPASLGRGAAIVAIPTGADLSYGLLLPLQCAAGIDFDTEHALVLVLPLAVMAAAGTIIGVGLLVGRVRRANARSVFVSAATIVLFQLHATLMRKLLLFLDCDTIEGESRHAEDYATPCEGATFDTLYATTLLGIAVYVVGIPVFGAAVVLWLRRRGLLRDPSSLRHWGFLYHGFRLRSSLYEAMITVRKAALVVVAVAGAGAAAQHAYGLLIVTAALAVLAHDRPYESSAVNGLEALSLSAIAVSIASGIAVHDDLLSTVALLLHAAFLAAATIFLVRALTQRAAQIGAKSLARSEEEAIDVAASEGDKVTEAKVSP